VFSPRTAGNRNPLQLKRGCKIYWFFFLTFMKLRHVHSTQLTYRVRASRYRQPSNGDASKT
jgi:hypothetical protein